MSALLARRYSDRAAAILVWLVWLGMAAYAIGFVATYHSRVLFIDDLTLIYVRFYKGALYWQELWTLHNEHRIPLPRMIQWALYGLTGDVRSGSYASIAVLAAISAAMIVAARHWRGRSSLLDAFFPLIWLHTGNFENLLMGFQISLMLPTALACSIVLVSISRAHSMRLRDALVSGGALVGLPLCGGPGMLQAPPLALWLAAVGLAHVRRSDTAEKRSGWILLGAVALTLTVGVLYFVGFEYPPGSERNHALAPILDVALRLVALSIGQAAEPWWPWSGAYTVLAAVSGMVVAVLALRAEKRTAERWRAAAVLAGLATSAALALGVGIGRGSAGGEVGFANRYVGMPAPILCFAYFAWLRHGRPLPRAIVQTSLVFVLVAAHAFENVRRGLEFGRAKHSCAVEFEKDVESGMGLRALCRKYNGWMDQETDRFLFTLRNMAQMRVHPFDRYPPHSDSNIGWSMFEVAPRKVMGKVPPAERRINDETMAIVAAGGTAFVFDVPADVSGFVGVYGMLDEAWRAGRCPPARVTIAAYGDFGRSAVMLDRTLDPIRVPADRGKQEFNLPIPDIGTSSVRITISAADPEAQSPCWVWLREIAFS